MADYAVSWQSRTESVRNKKPNGIGLFDMSGNVYEWVEDCWHNNYQEALTDGAAWLEANGAACGRRVLRGGSWSNRPEFLRVSNRSRNSTDDRTNDIGFRLVQDSES